MQTAAVIARRDRSPYQSYVNAAESVRISYKEPHIIEDDASGFRTPGITKVEFPAKTVPICWQTLNFIPAIRYCLAQESSVYPAKEIAEAHKVRRAYTERGGSVLGYPG